MQNLQTLGVALALLAVMTFFAVIIAGVIGHLFVQEKQCTAKPVSNASANWGIRSIPVIVSLAAFGLGAPYVANILLQPEETSYNAPLQPGLSREPVSIPSPDPSPNDTQPDLDRIVRLTPFAMGAVSTVESREASGDAKVAVEDLRKFSVAVELLLLSKTLRLSDRLKADHAISFDAGSAAVIHQVADGIRSNCPSEIDPENFTPQCREFMQKSIPDLLKAGDQLRTVVRY